MRQTDSIILKIALQIGVKAVTVIEDESSVHFTTERIKTIIVR